MPPLQGIIMKKNLLKSVWNVKVMFLYLLVPMMALAFYCSGFAYFTSRFLSKVISYFFTIDLLKLDLTLIGVVLLLFLVLLIRKGNTPTKIKFSLEKPETRHYFLLLLPLIPIVQYVITNQSILTGLDSIVVIAFFCLLTALLVLVFPSLTGNPSTARIVRIIGLAFILTLTSMPLLCTAFKWYQHGSFIIQLLFFTGILVITALLISLKNPWALNITVLSLFLFNTIFQVTIQLLSEKTLSKQTETNDLILSVAGKKPEKTPNVYLLVYDAYVSNETMQSHGIDNSQQEGFLRDMGFTFYPHTYSIGPDSLDSMSRVLNASTQFYGNPRKAVSGDGVVQGIFHSLGYQTAGVFPSDYFVLGIEPSYDYLFPKTPVHEGYFLSRAILEGEFRFDFGFDTQPNYIYLPAKQEVLQGLLGAPFFIYSHTNLPAHSQISGACRPNEVELYAERLAIANEEMKHDVEEVINYDPQAIIIVAGDHGPWLTKNCLGTLKNYDISQITRLDIQDRFGTFLAIKWPDQDYMHYDEITILQDIFPAVFAYMYQDSTILNAKIRTRILPADALNGVMVDNGIIIGGVNDGEPLFLSGQ
jgi:hypothetical protein